MKTAVYIATGLAVILQTFWLLMWAIWGAPTSIVEYVALVGGLFILVAMLLSIWFEKTSICLVSIGLIMAWCFYLPSFGIVLFHSENASWDAVSIARVFSLFALLTLSSVFAAKDGRGLFRDKLAVTSVKR